MFLGTFTPKLLAKGQISLPAKIRSALGADRAVLTTGFEKCIYGFSIEEWNKLAALELAKPLSSDEGRAIRRKMFAAACEIDTDDQGRFVLPEFLRDYAGIKEDLVVIGAGDHFEIWSNSEYARISNESTRT